AEMFGLARISAGGNQTVNTLVSGRVSRQSTILNSTCSMVLYESSLQREGRRPVSRRRFFGIWAGVAEVVLSVRRAGIVHDEGFRPEVFGIGDDLAGVIGHVDRSTVGNIIKGIRFCIGVGVPEGSHDVVG